MVDMRYGLSIATCRSAAIATLPDRTPIDAAWLKAALFTIAGCVLIASMGALAKHLGDDLPPLQVAFLRFLLAVPLVVLVAGKRGRSVVRTRFLGLHTLRSAMAGLTLVCAFYAYANMPLADAAAILFMEPVLIVLLAVLLARRRPSRASLAALALGAAGVLTILGPGMGVVSWTGLVALGAALFAATSALLIREIAKREGDGPLLLLGTALTAVCLAGPALLVWRSPAPGDWPLLFLIAAMGSMAQLLIIRAYRLASPARLAAFEYVQLPTAFLIGALAFAEPIAAATVLGTVQIVLATVVTARAPAVAVEKP